MLNLFELFVKIGVDDQASRQLKDIEQKLGSGLKTAAKIGTAAVTAAAAGIAALTGASVSNYAEYEQLAGGVETLFKNSADTVQQYAANAYKTAGLSANKYLSTVTSFSASLLQSLEGDTEAAAQYADTAVTDMADNANKMGTAIEMLQTAYAGFAKQNFTMLDNLKLGYGGTKEEMQRLLDDAEKISGIKYDISSFADITQAIHVMQEEMGIAGATALEAGTTIEGSVNAMKSAWQNLLTGLADGNADVGKLVDNLVTTIVGDGTESNLGVLGNVMPAVKTALSGASRLVGELLPEIVQEIPAIINDNLPILAEAAISIIQSLVYGISENQEMLMTTAIETITYLAESLITMLPQIVQLGLDLIVSLATGIAENLDTLIPTVMDVVLQIVDTLTDPKQLSNLLDAALVLLTELAYGLMDAIPQLVDACISVIEGLVSFLLNPSNIGKLISAAIQIVLAIATGLVNAIPQLLSYAGELIGSLVDSFKETDWRQVGIDIVNGIWNGLKSMWESLKSWFISAWDGLVGGVKNLLQIHSPSRVFVDIAKNMVLGTKKGWDDNFGSVRRSIERDMSFDPVSATVNASVQRVSGGISSSRTTTSTTDALLMELIGMLRAGLRFDGGAVLDKIVGYTNKQLGAMQHSDNMYAMG